MLPSGFGLALDPSARRPRRELLIGGSPLRVLRLTPAGAALVDRWVAGEPVGVGSGPQRLAARLLDAGIAHPRPQPGLGPSSADVTVVIPVKDNPVGLTATFSALGAAGPVIVVDDGSTPPVDGAALTGCEVIRCARSGGPAAARNRGWIAAGSELVAFVDADCLPARGWLDRLLPHFADPNVAAAAPRIVSAASGGTPAWLAGYERVQSSLDLGRREAPVRPGSPVPYVPTAALVVRRAALEAAGGFDESMRFGEDVDLVWRLAGLGWRVRYEPAATVAHPPRPGPGAWLRQRFEYGLSAAPLARRHGGDVAPVAVSPWSATAWLLAAIGHPGAGSLVAVGSGAALGRRAGSDQVAARALIGLALTGHARAGPRLAEAVRRAWLPLAVGVVAAAPVGTRWRRSTGRALAAAVLAPPVAEWYSKRPHMNLPAWVAARLADDLSYLAGVWVGAWRARSAAALLPRW